MNRNRLLSLIRTALVEADEFVKEDYNGNEKPMIGTKKALYSLQMEIKHNPQNINERVLRAMHDTGIAAAKVYYNSPLEKSIISITELLYDEIPSYKDLKPLGMDFGKGDPI